MVTFKKHIVCVINKPAKFSYRLLFILFLFLTSFSAAQNLVAVNYNESNQPIQKVVAEEEQIEFNSLSGDWWGVRTNLYKSGYEFNFTMKNEVYSSLAGNNSGSDYLNMFDFNATLDLNELLGWEDMTFFAQILGINGTAPEVRSGAIQGISNIASPQQWRIYQLLISKRFFGNSLSVAFGLVDLNCEFDARATSCLFLNPSFGIGADFARSGLNGPSIFPSTSLAVKAKYNPTEHIYLLTGIFDAVPGNHYEPYLTHVFAHSEDGVLLAGEFGYYEDGEELKAGYGKYNIGGWYYPQAYDDLAEVDESGNPLRHVGNAGFYLNAEKFVCPKPGSTELGLSVFGRLGFANRNINAVQTFWGIGLNISGVFSDNPEEVLGFAVANARMSDKFVLMNTANTNEPKFNETIFELTYSFNLLNWLRVQPDFQYVINPNQSINNRAFVAGLRVEMSF